MILFVPIRKTFSGSVTNASGTITQWAYTVPTGRRAELYYVFLRLQESPAIALGNAFAWVNVGGVTNAFLLPVQNAIQDRISQQGCLLDLSAGEVVQGVTFNNSASTLTMAVYAFIREYQ